MPEVKGGTYLRQELHARNVNPWLTSIAFSPSVCLSQYTGPRNLLETTKAVNFNRITPQMTNSRHRNSWTSFAVCRRTRQIGTMRLHVCHHPHLLSRYPLATHESSKLQLPDPFTWVFNVCVRLTNPLG